MGCVLYSLVSAGCVLAGCQDSPGGGSFLYQPAYCLDDVLRCPAEPYCPQPGDIVLSTDRLFFWKVMFNLALTGHPHHSGIVVALPDGKLRVLESGPYDTTHVAILDWHPHLCRYQKDGAVWIRRRRTPLTPEQSAKLTAWAQAQNHKRFALVRLAGQLTLLRSRGPLRTWFAGGPHGERSSYFCSELLMESCVAAGLVDSHNVRPAATYPRDVFFDASVNLFNNTHLNLSADWYPPARWTSSPCPQP
jgi:hypothetical protein